MANSDSSISEADYLIKCRKIERLVLDIYASIDGRSDDLPEQFFCNDAILKFDDVSIEGKDNISSFFSEYFATNDRNVRARRHIILNSRVDFQSGTECTIRSMVIIFAGEGRVPLKTTTVSGVGDLLDQCVEQDGRWLISKREATSIFVHESMFSVANWAEHK